MDQEAGEQAEGVLSACACDPSSAQTMRIVH